MGRRKLEYAVFSEGEDQGSYHLETRVANTEAGRKWIRERGDPRRVYEVHALTTPPLCVLVEPVERRKLLPTQERKPEMVLPKPVKVKADAKGKCEEAPDGQGD